MDSDALCGVLATSIYSTRLTNKIKKIIITMRNRDAIFCYICCGFATFVLQCTSMLLYLPEKTFY